MRHFRWVEPGDDGEPVVRDITDAGILAEYYPYWCNQLRAIGREHLISPEACVEDFVVVHWAEELES